MDKSNGFNKARAQSASGARKSADRKASADDNDDAFTSAHSHNLDKIFEEIEALNNTDNCLTSRIQILEKALKATAQTM